MSKQILVIDTETTGVNVFEDRIVTCFIGLMNGDGIWEREKHFLIDPGVPIPDEAVAIHGITNEVLAAKKKAGLVAKPLGALVQIRALLKWAIDSRIPIVAYNAPFDLSLITAELQRHGIERLPLAEEAIVIDPLVIDKALDKYRKGSRKLVDTAAHYSIDVDPEKAHDASYDCLLAGQIAFRVIDKSGRTLPDLHLAQIDWKREQASSLQEFFRSRKNKNGADPNAVVDGGFPVHTALLPHAEEAAA